MKIVIEIPEEYYNAIKAIPDIQCTADMLIIKNGAPLPKGHGRLIDISEHEKYFNTAITYDDGNHEHVVYTNTIPTIVEGSDSE